MFSSRRQLEKRTGPHNLDRFHYLQELVTEFQETQSRDDRLQVLANLANFAYDPINYEWMRKLNVIDLFLDVLAEEEGGEKMKEFAIGGLCNLCLDGKNRELIVEGDGIPLVVSCLSSRNEETVLSAITTLMFLCTPATSKAILIGSVRECMLQFVHSSNRRLANLATVFVEDCLVGRAESDSAGN
ncbi:uncharacterized protein VTP21DRAFT_3790 [Calcarisporiella thermophila]|uniref:uncharacterized protein n=1 Tax=Calcarisporiella thermophila TaxID=911321 RepID=UPI003742303A